MKPGSTPALEVQPALPELDRGEWWTPDWLFDRLDREFGPFNLDAAASATNSKCQIFYSVDDDGRTLPWLGKVFCNPPYFKLIDWVRHAYEECRCGRCELACLVLPAHTSTDWFHDFALPHGELHWIRRKVKFGGLKTKALMPTVILVFRASRLADG